MLESCDGISNELRDSLNFGTSLLKFSTVLLYANVYDLSFESIIASINLIFKETLSIVKEPIASV